jgi:hypothetical protein
MWFSISIDSTNKLSRWPIFQTTSSTIRTACYFRLALKVFLEAIVSFEAIKK